MTTTAMDLAAVRTGRSIPVAERRRAQRRSHHGAGSWIAPLVWMILLALFVAGLGAVALLRDGVPAGASTTISVRVSPSDTLWSIARANPQPGATTAATVEAIARANALGSSSLTPGTVLRVPASSSGGNALAQAGPSTITR
jgi:LysM domain.